MSDYVPKTKDFTNAPLCLSGHGVTKVFGLGEKKTVAVDHVDFDFHEGEFVSIVGESGSGKTTLSKMLLGLLNQTEGEILFQGKPRDVSSHRKKKEYWRGIQAIFQDPFSSLDPRMTVSQLIAEPLKYHPILKAKNKKELEKETEETVLELMRTEPAMKDAPDAVELTDVKGQVDVDHVSFAYEGDLDVLHDVDLHIKAGETLAVVARFSAIR